MLCFNYTTGLTVFIGAIILAYGVLRASSKLHLEILHNTLRSPMTFFDTTPIGRLVNRFSKDVDIIDMLVPRNIDIWIKCTVHVFSTIFIITYSTPIILVIVLPLGVVYYFVQVLKQFH